MSTLTVLPTPNQAQLASIWDMALQYSAATAELMADLLLSCASALQCKQPQSAPAFSGAPSHMAHSTTAGVHLVGGDLHVGLQLLVEVARHIAIPEECHLHNHCCRVSQHAQCTHGPAVQTSLLKGCKRDPRKGHINSINLHHGAP